MERNTWLCGTLLRDIFLGQREKIGRLVKQGLDLGILSFGVSVLVPRLGNRYGDPSRPSRNGTAVGTSEATVTRAEVGPEGFIPSAEEEEPTTAVTPKGLTLGNLLAVLFFCRLLFPPSLATVALIPLFSSSARTSLFMILYRLNSAYLAEGSGVGPSIQVVGVEPVVKLVYSGTYPNKL